MRQIVLAALMALSTCGHPAYAGFDDRMQDTIRTAKTPKVIDCAMVRWAVAHFSREFLLEQARARGITDEQKRKAQACLKR